MFTSIVHEDLDGSRVAVKCGEMERRLALVVELGDDLGADDVDDALAGLEGTLLGGRVQTRLALFVSNERRLRVD